MNDLAALYWPAVRAAEGLEVLAQAAGFPVGSDRGPVTPRTGIAEENRVPAAAASLGLYVEPIDASFAEVGGLLRSAGPAVIRVNGDAFIMLVRRCPRGVRVVSPDHRIKTVSLDVLRRAIVDPAATPLIAENERLVREAGVRRSRRPAAVRALMAERLRSQRFDAGWLVRLRSASHFRLEPGAAGVYRHLLLLTLAHAAQYGLWIAAWYLLGRAALSGRLDTSWLWAWTLALFSLVPLQLAVLWLQGRLSITVGALLKQRLLTGALRLEPEEIRSQGAGQLLGRVIESEAIGSLALGGGFMALLSALELILSAIVVAFASPLLPVLLAVWVTLTMVVTAAYFGQRLEWVRQRVNLTHDLIEQMVGHRTRIAQQPREQWHDGEDEALERYVRTSARMDRTAISLLAIAPRGWIVIGLCGLSPLFVQGGSPASVAIGLGGIVLAFRALHRLTAGLWNLAGAWIAWRQVAPIFRAAARGTLDSRALAPTASTGIRSAAVLDATDLRFTHLGRGNPVLNGCSIAIGWGERVILQGGSGGGKSTLASLLAGFRTPQSGLLLLDGLDRPSLGLDGWRRRVVLVPQFHENHVMLGSVAFNALMGSRWPPDEQDLARADSVLRELGLGATLDRMPSGVIQTIGETGWQLSHGERSRLYLARALLQNPDVLILDESFAQLDPQNMQLALDAVLARTSAVLLIAHP